MNKFKSLALASLLFLTPLAGFATDTIPECSIDGFTNNPNAIFHPDCFVSPENYKNCNPGKPSINSDGTSQNITCQNTENYSNTTIKVCDKGEWAPAYSQKTKTIMLCCLTPEKAKNATQYCQ